MRPATPPEAPDAAATGPGGAALSGSGARIGRARWLFGVILFAALIGAVLHFGDLEEFVALARAARPGWLLLAVGAQVVTYLTAGAIWWTVLKRAGAAQPLASLARLAVVKLFADQAIPMGGMSGTVILVRALARRGIAAPITMAVLLVDMVTYYAAYLVVVLIGIGLLVASHQADGAILAGAAVFTITVVAVPAAVLWARHVGVDRLPAWTARLPRAVALLKAVVEAPTDLLSDRGLMIRVAALQFGIFMLDALTLWLAIRALDGNPAFWIGYAAFVIASAAATISVLPLGLGSFEAASVAVLHLLGVSLGLALAATLLLRMLTFWLPMIPGLLLTRREFSTSA